MTDDPLPPAAADPATLVRLWNEHLPALRRVVGRRLDPSLAVRLDPDDVLGDAFLDARREWPRVRAAAAVDPYAWLYGVVRDRLIEAWRHATRDRRDVRRDVPWPERSSAQLALDLVSPGTSPSDAAARDEERRRVRAALDRLRDADREVLWMRHFDQLTFAQIGGVLRLTENAATVRYVRALRRLKDLWRAAEGGRDE